MLHVRELRASLQDALACSSDDAIADLKRLDASGHDIQLRVKGELDIGEFTELVLAIRLQHLDALKTETAAAEHRLTELHYRVKREETELEKGRLEKGLPADVEAMAKQLGAAVAAGDDAALRVQAHALLAKAWSIEDRRKRVAKEQLAKKRAGVGARSTPAGPAWLTSPGSATHWLSPPYGHPPHQSGEPAPLRCRREAAAVLWQLPKVADFAAF